MANIILQKPILPQEHNGIIDKGKLQPPTIDMDIPVFNHISMYDTLTAHFRPAHGGSTIDGGSLVVYRTNMSDYDISTQASLVPVGEYYAYYTVTSVAQPSEPIPSPPVYVKIIDSINDKPIIVYSSFGVNPDNILEQYQPVCGNETANNVINCYTLSNYKNNKVVDGLTGDVNRAALFVVVNKNRLSPSDSSVTLDMNIVACYNVSRQYGPIYMSSNDDHVTFSIPYYDVTGIFNRGNCQINGGPLFGYGSIQFTFSSDIVNQISPPWQGRIITCGSAYQGCSGPGCPDHSYDCPDCASDCPNG